MAPTAQPANPSGFRVTSQVDQSGQDATGKFVAGRSVQFVTGNGTPGSVFIPLTLYTPDNVMAAIANQAAIIDAVDAFDTTGK